MKRSSGGVGTTKMSSGEERRRRTNDKEEEPDHWSSIPGEILDLITGKFTSIDYYFRLTAVCRSWHSHAADFRTKPRFEPLYIPRIDSDSNTITLRNPTSDTTWVLPLPETVGKYLWGSPFGWLISLDPMEYGPGLLRWSLFNPFTRATIPLPALPDSWSHGAHRIMPFLTASPDSDPDDLFIVIYSEYIYKLAFLHLGRVGSKWSSISTKGSDFFGFTYLKGNLYGIKSSSENHNHPLQLVCFRSKPKCALVPILSLPLTPHYLSSQVYLFYLNGQLCLCRQDCGFHSTSNIEFESIDLSTGELTTISSLGGHFVFLERNYTFSYEANYARTELFGQPIDAWSPWTCSGNAAKLPRDCVFYYNRFCEVEVWDVSYSGVVFTIKNDRRRHQMPKFPALWILPALK